MVARRMTVQPSVLTWARESANLDVNEAAHRMSVSVSRIEQWESGSVDPTINQLRKAAAVYTRPLRVREELVWVGFGRVGWGECVVPFAVEFVAGER